MKFQHGSYYHSMDQNYYIPDGQQADSDLNVLPQPESPLSSLGPGEIGFSSNPFQHPIQAIQARIKEGVGYIDIPFFGAGKGNKERYTPESIDAKERRDIKELADMNKIKLSTHASTNIQGLAGLGREGFDDQQRRETLKEIQKAIDFASDLQGGAVVFHTGEFPRPFTEQEWYGDDMFVHYPEEAEKAVLHMVDDRSGQVIGSVRKNQLVFEPQYMKSEKKYVDSRGREVKSGDFIDIDGNYLDPRSTEDRFKRVAVWDESDNSFKTTPLNWDDFVERAGKYGTRPEFEFYKAQIDEQIIQAKGTSLYYAQDYEGYMEDYKIGREALKFYEKLEAELPEEEKVKIMQKAGHGRWLGMASNFVQDQYLPPSEMLKESLKVLERRLNHVHEASSAADVRASDLRDKLEHMKPVYEYGLDKSADTIARAGEYALQMTRQKNTERPVYVSPESYLPSLWGSHPDEIERLINMSRNRMTEILRSKNQGLSESEAKEQAKTHIQGTLDVGHFNLWRQYWQAKPGQTIEQSDKEFEKWFLKKVDGLLEAGVIGQVHITDNLGFDDEHLTPGQGNVPMKAVMDLVEKHGMKDLIVESGSFNATRIVGETMAYFGSPIYSVSRGPSFTQFYQRSFGYTAPPFYIVGAYVPSNEWRAWSEVQLE
ncbi:hypothetical protein ACFL1B_03395 [Nanoarchaeota archaeon]